MTRNNFLKSLVVIPFLSLKNIFGKDKKADVCFSNPVNDEEVNMEGAINGYGYREDGVWKMKHQNSLTEQECLREKYNHFLNNEPPSGENYYIDEHGILQIQV